MPMAKILVVEDDDASREFLRFVYGECRAPRAGGGGRPGGASDAVETGVPDLMVLDVMLPELHGYEVCNRLKRAEPKPQK
jgi:CheY-like chemotaxis protein